jgi:hypothetical protein
MLAFPTYRGSRVRIEKIRDPVPLVRRIRRRVPSTWAGPVYVWDVDQTYLDTRTSSTRALLTTALESAERKRPFPGSVALLRAIRRGIPAGSAPLYFVTASPPQLATTLEKRLEIDGVDHDGLVLKDQWRIARRWQWDQLRVQAAFKLAALLQIAADVPASSRLVLFGDDTEQDALVFSVLADASAGRISTEDVGRILTAAKVRDGYVDAVLRRLEDFPRRDLVAAIYVRLARRRDGQSLEGFGGHVYGWTSPTGVAEDLQSRGWLEAAQVATIGERHPSRELVRPIDTNAATWTPRAWLARSTGT